MTDPSVTEKLGSELAAGDVLAAGELHNLPTEILFSDSYIGQTGPWVMAVHRPLGTTGKPLVDNLEPKGLFRIATDAELEELKRNAKRDQLVSRLRDLADVIEARQLPVPEHAVRISAYASSGADVRAVAAALGADVAPRSGSKGVQVELAVGGPSYTPGALEITWYSLKDEPEPAEDLGASFDSSQMAEADVTPVPESRRYEPHFADGNTGEDLANEGDRTSAPVDTKCVFAGDRGGWCNTHQAVHAASGEAECGCPVYPFAGRGDSADTIVDHRRSCDQHPYGAS